MLDRLEIKQFWARILVPSFFYALQPLYQSGLQNDKIGCSMVQVSKSICSKLCNSNKGCACLCCMNPHDRQRIVYAEARQEWRAFAYVMQVHGNHCIKRAGVAGIRARAYRKVVEFKSVRCILCFEVHSKY
ncbi:hypothetical protein CIPOMM044M_01495 [Citrobacter portucalensis]